MPFTESSLQAAEAEQKRAQQKFDDARRALDTAKREHRLAEQALQMANMNLQNVQRQAEEERAKQIAEARDARASKKKSWF